MINSQPSEFIGNWFDDPDSTPLPNGFIGSWFSDSGPASPPTQQPVQPGAGIRLPFINLPIALPANATFYFERQDEGTTLDPATGNELQNTTILAIPAALRNQRVKMRDSPDAGFSRRSFLLMGYLLGDPALHATLDFSQEIDLTLRNGNGASVSGKFFLIEKPSPYHDQILAQIGTPIFGDLKLAGSGETF